MAIPRSSVTASSAARRSTSNGWTPCLMPGSASPARRKRKMANAADPLMAGPERRVFIAAAVGTVVLDLVTKLIAEATLLRTPGISVFGDWFQLRLVYNQGAAFLVVVWGLPPPVFFFFSAAFRLLF